MVAKPEQTSLVKKFFLVDGSALAYRSHFAFIRNPLTSSRGEQTSATFGFVRALLKMIDEEKPDYLAVIFDTPEPTFRHKAYAAYKATRQKMPEDLASQLAQIRQFSVALGGNLIEIPGFEADDVMGTLARQSASPELQVFLFTSDKDLMQFVNYNVFIYYTGRNEAIQILNAQGVREKLGVAPERVIDYLALLGDTSDNVPGVPKIGAKTAIELLEQFGSVEDILANADRVKRASVRDTLKANADQALLSKKLVTIDSEVPLNLTLDDLNYRGINQPAALSLARALEFKSLIPRFTPPPKAITAAYHIADTPEKVLDLIGKLEQAEIFAFDTETTASEPMRAELVGMSFSWEEGSAYYLPVAPPAVENDFNDIRLLTSNGDTSFSLKKALQPLLENENIKKCAQNAKYDSLVMERYGINMRGVSFDTLVACYVLNPGGRQHDLDSLCLEHFNYKKIPITDLIGSGKKQISMRAVPVAEVADYSGEDADFTLRLCRLFSENLKSASLMELYESIEMPLVEVLAAMEWHGVALDVPYLKDYSLKLEALLGQLIADIYAAAGYEFNINSSQQLSKILFEQLKLPRKRRTKTGFSTDADVLEKLAHYHELPRKLLDYREITKLKSTYVDSLPLLINRATDRVHPSFNQTVAATGRLSCSDPNLQNIPIRTELGRQIRRAFIPHRPGWKLVDADYSQVELRIMAHLSQDEAMIAAFRSDEDIHTSTASHVFNVPIAEMTPDVRRRAKEINFGILYGMESYGLSRRLDISVEEAHNFITNYFIQYPGVNAFIAGIIAQAHVNGYVTTLFNRKRYLPDINSANMQVRRAAERTAINTPIQGTAADLIKIAMINIHRRLKREGLLARMILQVHDELVFEAPENEIEKLKILVLEEMSGAVHLDVPIKIDVGVGDNWLEAH